MSKMTKEQRDYLKGRLQGLRSKWIKANADKEKGILAVDVQGVAKDWAKKNPKKFVELCFDSKTHGHLQTVWRQTPAVQRAVAKRDAEVEAITTAFEKAKTRIDAEYNRIMDELHFGDCEEAMKALASFQHLVESL